MKNKFMFGLLLMSLLVLSAFSVLGVGVYVAENENCCLDYYNVTDLSCYSNSTCTADGDVSSSVLCGRPLAGMGATGDHLGGFLTNLAPGIGTFILVMGIFGGIVAIIYGIVWAIKQKIGKD